jgi:hypothetical protein
MFVSVLCRQVLRRNFIEVVAPIIHWVRPKQTASAPHVDGGEYNAVVVGDFLRS